MRTVVLLLFFDEEKVNMAWKQAVLLLFGEDKVNMARKFEEK